MKTEHHYYALKFEFEFLEPGLIAFEEPEFLQRMNPTLFDDLQSNKFVLQRDWKNESSSRTYRSLSAAEILLANNISACSFYVINKTLLEICGQDNYQIFEAIIEDFNFGCIKVTWQVAVKTTKKIGKLSNNALVGSLGAMVIMNSCSIQNEPKPRINIKYECSESVHEPQAVSYMAKGVLNTNPESFMSPSCDKTRQRLLKYSGFYGGSIDGKFGNKSYAAEAKLANQFGILPDDRTRVYKKAISIITQKKL